MSRVGSALSYSRESAVKGRQFIVFSYQSSRYFEKNDMNFKSADNLHRAESLDIRRKDSPPPILIINIVVARLDRVSRDLNLEKS